jgi:hypothetical protein
MEGNRQEERVIWDPRWLPLTNDGKDAYHALDCGDGRGRVVSFFYVDLDLPGGPAAEFSGLPDMVAALTRRWRAGVYWQAGGHVAGDDRAVAAMRRSEDPEPPDVDQLVRDLAMRQQWEADFLRSLRLLRTRLYPEAVPGLVAMLTEGNANRFHAIELLGSIGDRAAIPALRAAGDRDRDPTTRTYAQKVLGELGSH